MSEDRVPSRIIDLHSHVLPGVDDGAQDMEQALAALGRLIDEGVEHVTATPHFRASLLERPSREAATLHAFDDAYLDLVAKTAEAGLAIEISRGCEFKLDAPRIDLSDPRLRLGGSRFALVEFASFQLPAFAGSQLAAVHEAGWVPVLAHPERYAGVAAALDQVEAWVQAGTLLQVNARSLLGWYGEEAQIAGQEILARGWACCLASDYHSRGAPDFGTIVRLLEGGSAAPTADGGSARAEEERETARRVIETLLSTNPAHILADTMPVRAPPWSVPLIDRKTRRGWFR